MQTQSNERSIWENVKFMISGIATAVGTSTDAIGKTARIVDSLAEAGVTMAESNQRLVLMDTVGKEAMRKAEIESKYKELELA